MRAIDCRSEQRFESSELLAWLERRRGCAEPITT
jgi:hypothetical protein